MTTAIKNDAGDCLTGPDVDITPFIVAVTITEEICGHPTARDVEDFEEEEEEEHGVIVDNDESPAADPVEIEALTVKSKDATKSGDIKGLVACFERFQLVSEVDEQACGADKACEIVVRSGGYLDPEGKYLLRAVAAPDRPPIIPVTFDWDEERPSTVATE